MHRGTSEHSHACDASFRQLRGSSWSRAGNGTEDNILVAILLAFCQRVYKDEVSYSPLSSMTKFRSGAFHLEARSIWISALEDGGSGILLDIHTWYTLKIELCTQRADRSSDHSRSRDATVRKHILSPPASGSMSTLGSDTGHTINVYVDEVSTRRRSSLIKCKISVPGAQSWPKALTMYIQKSGSCVEDSHNLATV